MQPEYLIERSKLKRQLSSWKFLAVVLIAGLLTIFLKFFDMDNGFIPLNKVSPRNNYIASVYLDGVINSDKKRDESLAKIIDDDNSLSN